MAEIEDKPKIDRRKIKNIKDIVEEDTTEPVKRKLLRAPWRTTILEDGTKNIIINQQIRFIFKNIMMRKGKKKKQ